MRRLISGMAPTDLKPDALRKLVSFVVASIIKSEKRQLMENWAIPFWSGYSQAAEDLAHEEVVVEVLKAIVVEEVVVEGDGMDLDDAGG